MFRLDYLKALIGAPSMRLPLPNPEFGWCSCCGQDCRGEIVDDGVGPYEFWGQTGVDVRHVTVSRCCGSSVLRDDPVCTGCGKFAPEEIIGGLCETCADKHQPPIKDRKNGRQQDQASPGLDQGAPHGNALRRSAEILPFTIGDLPGAKSR